MTVGQIIGPGEIPPIPFWAFWVATKRLLQPFDCQSRFPGIGHQFCKIGARSRIVASHSDRSLGFCNRGFEIAFTPLCQLCHDQVAHPLLESRSSRRKDCLVSISPGFAEVFVRIPAPTSLDPVPVRKCKHEAEFGGAWK